MPGAPLPPIAGTPTGSPKKTKKELKLTEMQISEFREAFALFDKDGDGHVTASELKVVFESLGQKPTKEDIDAMIAEVDDDGNGEMEFEEFALLMSERMDKTETKETLMEAFSMLDMDQGGSISRDELKRVMQNFSKAGEQIDDEEIDRMITECDVDGDGEISVDEFCDVMMRNE